MNSPIRWSVAVITAPRPIPTLDATMQGVVDAGWDGAFTCVDERQRGSWPNWLAALRESIRRNPDADAYAILEDDVTICRGVREYLQWALWPEPRDQVALCSIYRPACYTALMPDARGWTREYRGGSLIGSVAWVLPPSSARAILRDLGGVDGVGGIDAKVGQWALNAGLTTWYHAPSLVQHVANDNSALGIHEPIAHMRTASDFPGVDFDATDLIPREALP